MVKGKIIMADPDEYDVELELIDKAKKNGWLKEAQFIENTMKEAVIGKPVEIKPDYATCSEWCTGAEDEMACLDECME